MKPRVRSSVRHRCIRAEHADQTVHADPAVYQGVFTADCYPFRVALPAGRD
jgi:hypothetical protein